MAVHVLVSATRTFGSCCIKMRQPDLVYVISATVRALRTGLSWRGLRPPIARDYAFAIRIRHSGGSDAKVKFAGCDDSIRTHLADADRAGPSTGTGHGRHHGTCGDHAAASDNAAASGDDNSTSNDNSPSNDDSPGNDHHHVADDHDVSDSNHHDDKPVNRFEKDHREEAREEENDATAGDRSFDRNRHGPLALSQFGSEAVPAVHSVREAVMAVVAARHDLVRRAIACGQDVRMCRNPGEGAAVTPTVKHVPERGYHLTIDEVSD